MAEPKRWGLHLPNGVHHAFQHVEHGKGDDDQEAQAHQAQGVPGLGQLFLELVQVGHHLVRLGGDQDVLDGDRGLLGVGVKLPGELVVQEGIEEEDRQGHHGAEDGIGEGGGPAEPVVEPETLARVVEDPHYVEKHSGGEGEASLPGVHLQEKVVEALLLLLEAFDGLLDPGDHWGDSKP